MDEARERAAGRLAEAGPDGAIVSEFSTERRDDLDIFTDPEIRRATVVAP